MNTRKNVAFVLLTIWMCVFTAGHVVGQSQLPFKIYAERQDIQEDQLVASGSVEISWEDYHIYADYLAFNPKTKIITARGRVTMTSRETVITGERLQFNLKERTGVMYDSYGQMPPSVRYKTAKLTQVDNDTLKFDKLDFTSCAQCLPRWKLTCTGGKIKKEKYIELKNAVLKIKKIPVMYIPYIRYPLNKDGRATGFLFPKIGRSDLRGFFFLNSFYWPVKSNIDLTLGFDYYGNAGIGTSQELRYMFRKAHGEVKFYYFKYKDSAIIPEGETLPSDKFSTYNSSDYLLKMSHKQSINFLKTRIIAKVDKQSDANFLRLFSNDFYNVLRRQSRSSISINSTILPNLKVTANAAQNETYFTHNNKTNTVRYFPRLTANLNQQKVWFIPGYFSLGMSYEGVQRIGRTYDEDEGLYDVTDVKTSRLSFNPSYSLSLVASPWMSAKLKFESRQNFYFKSKDPETGDIVDETLRLGYHTATLDIKGPVFTKIYQGRFSRLKHLVIPGIKFRYVTQIDEEDQARLIRLDGFDFPSYSFLGFSLTTRLLYKGNQDKSPREILSYVVSQDYYFDPKLAHRSRKINGIFPEFSELKNKLRFRPVKDFSFDLSVVFNHFMEVETFLDNFTRLRATLSYNNRKSPVSGSFFYNRYLNPYVSSDNVFNRDSVGGKVNLDIPRFPLKFNADVNYDITDKKFRAGIFRLSYDYQCIIFTAEMRLFRYLGRIESQFNIGINFGNMGMVKDFLGTDL